MGRRTAGPVAAPVGDEKGLRAMAINPYQDDWWVADQDEKRLYVSATKETLGEGAGVTLDMADSVQLVDTQYGH